MTGWAAGRAGAAELPRVLRIGACLCQREPLFRFPSTPSSSQVQDTTLSRWRRGFKSRWGHHKIKDLAISPRPTVSRLSRNLGPFGRFRRFLNRRGLAIGRRGQPFQPALRDGRIVHRPRFGEDRLHARVQVFGQMAQHVALLVELATLHHAQVAEDLSDRRANRLRTIDDKQPGLFLGKTPFDQVAQQRLGNTAVLRGSFPQPQNLLPPVAVDASAMRIV